MLQGGDHIVEKSGKIEIDFQTVTGDHVRASGVIKEKTELVYKYPYFYGKEPLHFASEYTYTDQDVEIKNVETYEWQHTFGDIITALINEGFTIESIKEYPYTLFPQFPFVEEVEKGIWKFKDDKYNVPMIFSIKAVK